MFKQLMRWRCIALSHRKTWTERDSFSLCCSLAIILPSGRIDWVQCGRMTDILSGRMLSKSGQQFKQFLTRLVMYRYAWWDGRCVQCSDYPRGHDADYFCRTALAAVR